MGYVELARSGAGLTPGEKMFAVGRVFVDSGVSIAVGNVEILVARIDGHVSAPVEGIATHERSWLTADAES